MYVMKGLKILYALFYIIITIAILIDFLGIQNLKPLLYKESNNTRGRYILRLRSDCYIKLRIVGGRSPQTSDIYLTHI